MLVVQTTIPIDPERRETAVERAAALAERAAEEPGTLRYRASEGVDDPALCFFEAYEDAAAAAAHRESDAYRAFVEALPTVAAGGIETVQFEVDEEHVSTFEPEAAVEALE